MTAEHREIIDRAAQWERDLANDPWRSSVSADERMKSLRTMNATQLVACLNWPSTQMSVKCAIESRLRSLRKRGAK